MPESKKLASQFTFRRLIRRAADVLRQEGFKTFWIIGVDYINTHIKLFFRRFSVKRSSKTQQSLETMILRSSRFSDDPVVSIVIPVLNGIDYVPNCIRSIYRWPIARRFEVILVDQASQDGVGEYLEDCVIKYHNFVLLKNTTNTGFAPGINQGVAIAHGEYIAICNSDLVFTPGWLDHLVLELEEDPTLGIVSPVTNYVGEGPQVDPGAENLDSSQAAEYAVSISDRKGRIDAADRLVFFCVAMRRKLYITLGGLAAVYKTGNYEDDDFCLRTRMLGLKLTIIKRAFVFHYGSRSFKENKIDHTDLMLQNEKIFYERVANIATSMPLIKSAPSRSKPKISVIVRTKDRPYLLQQALRSLANQTYHDFEVVVINDGQMDIAPVIHGLLQYMTVRTISPQKHGRTIALNTGLEEARGDWITYLDDDDLAYPSHLELLMGEAVSHRDADLIYSNVNKSLSWEDVSQSSINVIERIRFADKNFQWDDLLVDNWIPIMSYMNRVSKAREINGFQEKIDLFEDWDFLLRFTRTANVYHVHRYTCEYRFRFNNVENHDSTLPMRRQALAARTKLYSNYPSASQLVVERRKISMKKANDQINEIDRIIKLNINNQQKNYMVATLVGGFPIRSKVLDGG